MGRGRSASFLPNNFLSISLRFSSLSPVIRRALMFSTGARNLNWTRISRTIASLDGSSQSPYGSSRLRRNCAARTRSSHEESRWESSDIELRFAQRSPFAFYVTIKYIVAKIDRIAISSSGAHLHGFESLHESLHESDVPKTIERR